MQQWQYFSLVLPHDNNNLYGYEHTTGPINAFAIPADLLIDPSPANTLRRWNAALGQDGWELVSILNGDNSQEWIYKRPYIS